MASKRHDLLPLTDEEGEVRELTAEDFARMRPAREVDPEMVAAFEKLRAERGLSILFEVPEEERVELSVESETVKAFQAGGADWAERMAHVLTVYAKSKRDG